MRRQVLGPRHADVAITLVELSRALRDQGKAAEAEPLAREALAIRRAVFGEEHRETATSKSDLGAAPDAARRSRRRRTRCLRQTLDDDAAGARARASEHRVLDDVPRPDPARQGRSGRPPRCSPGRRLAVQRRVLRCRARRVRQFLDHARPDGGVAGPAGRGRADLRGVPAHRAGTAARRSSRRWPPTWSISRGCGSRAADAGGNGAAASRGAPAAHRHACWRTTGASDRCRACSARRSSARGRDAEAESLMRAADRLLQPIAGRQARERDANRARLAALYRASGRPSRPTWRADPRPAGRRGSCGNRRPPRKFVAPRRLLARGSRSFT